MALSLPEGFVLPSARSSGASLPSGFSRLTQDDVVAGVGEKIAAKDTSFTLGEYELWRAHEDAKGLIEQGGEMVEGIGEGVKGLVKTAKEAGGELVTIEEPTALGTNPMAVLGAKLVPTAAEAVMQWMTQLGTAGQNIASGVTGSFKDDGLEGDYGRLQERLQRDRAADIEEGSSIVGELATGATGSVKAGEAVSGQVLPSTAKIGSLAPDFLVAGGSTRLLRGTQVGAKASQMSSKLVKAMGVPSARLARKVDQGIQKGFDARIGAGAVAGAGLAAATVPEQRLSIAKTVAAGLGLRLGYGALRGVGSRAARAVKAKVEHGITGRGQLTLWDQVARDAAKPVWARRAAMTAAAVQRSRGAAIAKGTSQGAVLEGMQEGFEEWLQQDKTAKEIGQGIGAGSLIGGLAGAAFSGNVDAYFSDLDAIRMRDAMEVRGDDVAYFDSLDASTRRKVTDQQSFLGEVAEVRFTDQATIEAEAGQALPLAKGVFLDRERGQIFVNTEEVAPSEVSGVLGHEAGHAIYHGLPEPIKQKWRELAADNWTPEQIETFKRKYEEKLGAVISEETAVDELFAEQFLGGNARQGALRKKRALNLPGRRSRRALASVKASMLEGLGIDPGRVDKKDLFEFTPFSESPELRAFVEDAVADLDLYTKPSEKPPALPKAGKVGAESDAVGTVADAIDGPAVSALLELSNGTEVMPLGVSDGETVRYVEHGEVMRVALAEGKGESLEVAVENTLERLKAGEDLGAKVYEAPLGVFEGAKEADAGQKAREAERVAVATALEGALPEAGTDAFALRQFPNGLRGSYLTEGQVEAIQRTDRRVSEQTKQVVRDVNDVLVANHHERNAGQDPRLLSFDYAPEFGKKGRGRREVFPLMVTVTRDGELLTKGIDMESWRDQVETEGVPPEFESEAAFQDAVFRNARRQPVSEEERIAISGFNDPVIRSYRFDRIEKVHKAREGLTLAQEGAATVESLGASRTLADVRDFGLMMSKGRARREITARLRRERGDLFDAREVDRELLTLYPQDAVGLSALYSETSEIAPDQMAGALGFERVDELYDVIRNEAGMVASAEAGLRAQREALDQGERAQVAAEAKEGVRWDRALTESGADRTPAGELGEVGTTIIIDGTEVTVSRKDENEVALDGGSRFGVQVVPSTKLIPVEGFGEFVDVAFSPAST